MNAKMIQGDYNKPYKWKDDGKSYGRRPRVINSQAEDRNQAAQHTANLVSCVLLCAMVIMVAFYFIQTGRLSNYNKQINEILGQNQAIEDSIDSYKSAISDATSYATISQLAEEACGMVNGNNLNGVTVYIPNRGNAVMTASGAAYNGGSK